MSHGSSVLATVGGDRVGVITGFETAWPGGRALGRAFTAHGLAGDNLVLHRALAEATTGDVIVASLDGERQAGHWGELTTIAAHARGIAGLVIDATVRDRAELAARRFPVFHRGTCPSSATKVERGELQVAIELAGVSIEPGDLIAADDDGVVVVPARLAQDILTAAAELESREHAIALELEQGQTTIAALGLESAIAHETPTSTGRHS